MSWEPDNKLLKQIELDFEDARSGLEAGESDAALRLLQAAGRLSLMSVPVPAVFESLRGRLTAALAQLAVEPLEDAAALLTGEAPELHNDFSEAAALNSKLNSALTSALHTRSQWEFVIQGARLLGEGEIPQDQEVAMLEFEQLVEPMLYQLVPLNHSRAEALRAIAPKHRSQFWWLSRGVHLPTTALDSLTVAAELLESFPAAEAELSRLRRAQQLLNGANAKGPPANVVSLADWVAARRTKATTDRAEERLAAGFDSSELTLLTTPEFELCWAEPDRLIVDLLVDRAPGQLPELVKGAQRYRLAEVPDCEERFALRVPNDELQAGEFVLELPLQSGIRRITLPPNP